MLGRRVLELISSDQTPQAIVSSLNKIDYTLLCVYIDWGVIFIPDAPDKPYMFVRKS